MLEFIQNFDNKILYLSFLVLIVFLVLSFFSWKYITKLKKFYHIANFILLFLLLKVIFTDDIAAIFVSIFWYFIVEYLLKFNFARGEKEKQNALLAFVFDICCLFVVLFLFLIGFVKFFLLNNISFSFTEAYNYIYHINHSVVLCAFMGLMILVFRLFGFFPFNFSSNALSFKIHPLFSIQQSFTSAILAVSILIKSYNIFSECFLSAQLFLGLYLILNLLWFPLLLFKNNCFDKFLLNSLSFNFAFLFLIFLTDSEFVLSYFTYGALLLLLSFIFVSLIFVVYFNIFKTFDISKFKLVDDKTHRLKILTILSLMNYAKVMPFGLFMPFLIIIVNTFMFQFEDFLFLIPYVAVVSVLFFALCSINLIFKVVINVQNNNKIYYTLLKSEFLMLCILFFVVLLLGFLPQHLCEKFMFTIESF